MSSEMWAILRRARRAFAWEGAGEASWEEGEGGEAAAMQSLKYEMIWLARWVLPEEG